jgi:hypothetical protein
VCLIKRSLNEARCSSLVPQLPLAKVRECERELF